jgi:urease gamma subunit
MIVEEALWRELGRLSGRDNGAVTQRLKHLDALVSEIIADVRIMNASKELANKREQEAGAQRLNEVAEKIRASMNQIFDLVQTEPLAEADDRRAVMYRVLARLAVVSATLLEGAAEGTTLAETDKLHEDQLAFEEVVKQLQDEAKELTAEK